MARILPYGRILTLRHGILGIRISRTLGSSVCHQGFGNSGEAFIKREAKVACFVRCFRRASGDIVNKIMRICRILAGPTAPEANQEFGADHHLEGIVPTVSTVLSLSAKTS